MHNVKQLVNRAKESIFFCPSLIILAILVANSPSIIGPFKHNPLYINSGLLVKSQPSALPGVNTIDPTDGTSSQSLGREAVRQLVHGSIPWWNHNEQVGAPLAGDMQSAALFPLVVLYALPFGFLLIHIILEVIAGLYTYALLRKIQVSKFSSTLGGILFGLSGVFAWFGAANVNPVAFLPMLLYGIENAYASSKVTGKGLTGWICIAFALALSLYAGFPEVAYLDGLLAAGWFFVRLWMQQSGSRKRFLVRVLLGGGVGVLLEAPILIAFGDYLPYADVSMHSTANTDALPLFGLSALLMPYIYGPIFGYTGFDKSLITWWGSVGGYMSVLLLFFAVAGLGSKRFPKKMRVLLASFAVIGLLRIYGFPGLAQLLNFLPGMSVTAANRYLMPVVLMAGVILAGFGIDLFLETAKSAESILRKIERLSPAIIVSIVSIVTAGIVAMVEHHKFATALDHVLWLRWSIVWALVSSLGLLPVLLYARRTVHFFVATLILIDAIGLFVIPQLSAVRQPNIDLGPVAFLKAYQNTDRFFSLGPISANYGSYYGIASINTNNIPIVESWRNYIHTKLNPTVPEVSFNGSIQAKDGPTQKEEFFKNIQNFEAVGVKYLIASRNVVTPSESAQYNLRMVYRDPAVEIFSLSAPKPYFLAPHCNIELKTRDELVANCSQPSTLTRLEAYMPGWSAKSNGQATAVEKADNLMQSIAVEKGSNSIVFKYEPPHIYLGYAAIVLGTAVALTCYWGRRITKS